MAMAVLTTAHALLTPMHRGPDETQHHDMVIHVLEEGTWPAPGERYVELSLRRSRRLTMWQLRGDRREESEARPRAEQPTWHDLEVATENGDQDTGGRNPATQHPFLYYTSMVPPWAVLQSAAVGPNHVQAVAGLRLTSALYVLPLPLLTMLTARRLRASRRAGQAATILVAAIPQLAHLSGLVNNDGLMNLLGFLFVFMLARVLRGHLERRHALLLGLVTGLGLLTKGFALGWLVLIVLAFAWTGHHRARLKTAVTSCTITVTTAMMVGGWWWVRNRILYGAVQPRPLLASREPPGPPENFDRFLDAFQVRFVDGFWGRFGTLDAPLPRWSTWTLWGVFVIAVIGGLVAWSRRRHAVNRIDLLLLSGVSGGVAVALIGDALLLYLSDGFARGMQGRYVFSGLSVVLVIAATGAERLLRRWVTPAIVVLAATLQLAGLAVVIHSWYGPRTGSWSWTAGIAAAADWLPWPGHVLGVVYIVGISAGVWATQRWAMNARFRTSSSRT